MLTKERLDQFLNSDQYQLNTEVYCDEEAGGIASVALFKRSIGPKTFMLYGASVDNEVLSVLDAGFTDIFQLMIFSPGRHEVFVLGTPAFTPSPSHHLVFSRVKFTSIRRTLYDWYSEQNAFSSHYGESALRRLSQMYMDYMRKNRKDQNDAEKEPISLEDAFERCFGLYAFPTVYRFAPQCWAKDILSGNNAFPILSIPCKNGLVFQTGGHKDNIRLCSFVDYYSYDDENQFLSGVLNNIPISLAATESADTDNATHEYRAVMTLRQAMKGHPSIKKLAAIYKAVLEKEMEVEEPIPTLHICYGKNGKKTTVIDSKALFDWAHYGYIKTTCGGSKFSDILLEPYDAQTLDDCIPVKDIKRVSSFDENIVFFTT